MGMKLRSNMSATNLVETAGPWSLKSYLADIGEHQDWPVPLSRFIAYGRWVQHTPCPTSTPGGWPRSTRPRGIRTAPRGRGGVTAGRVVVAAGIEPFEHRPADSYSAPSSVSHTGHHRDLSALAGKRVAVVGGGQSAFECAALLTERGAGRSKCWSEMTTWCGCAATRSRR